MATIISVLQTKGGSGKTTLSLNLARAIQFAGHEVLVVDSDPQGSARAWSSIDPDVPPSPPRFPVYGISHGDIERELERVGQQFDFVVLDGMAKMEIKVLGPAIRAADVVLVPVRPSGADILALDELVEALLIRFEMVGSPLPCFVVMGYTKGTTMGRQIDSALSDKGMTVLKARTSHLIAYADSFTSGVTVYELTDRSGAIARAEIEAIKDEIMELLNEQTGRQIQENQRSAS